MVRLGACVQFINKIFFVFVYLLCFAVLIQNPVFAQDIPEDIFFKTPSFPTSGSPSIEAKINPSALGLAQFHIDIGQTLFTAIPKLRKQTTERISGLTNATTVRVRGILTGNHNNHGNFIISYTYGTGKARLYSELFFPNGEHYILKNSSSGYELSLVNYEVSVLCDGSQHHSALESLGLPQPEILRAELSTEMVTTIDLLVAYTAEARIAVGGTSAMASFIDSLVEFANTVYENSEVDVDLRLVYAAEVIESETGTFSTELTRLQQAADGNWDEVHNWRETYGADLVTLLVSHNQGGAVCGLAAQMLNAVQAFSVLSFNVSSILCSGLSFTHELGHNMGASHDRSNSTNSLYSYSYGNRYTGESGSLWRTIMSYIPGNLTLYFSNPNLSYDGTATGVTNSEDNALALNNTKGLISGFKPTVVPLPDSDDPLEPIDPIPDPDEETTPSDDSEVTLIFNLTRQTKKRCEFNAVIDRDGIPLLGETLNIETRSTKARRRGRPSKVASTQVTDSFGRALFSIRKRRRAKWYRARYNTQITDEVRCNKKRRRRR